MNLSHEQLDALTEVISIGVGRAASSLSDLTGQHITLTVPKVALCPLEELDSQTSICDELIDTSIVQDFDGAISGRSILAFPRDSGLKLAQVLGGVGETPGELDLTLRSILNEVGNIVLNGVLGSISNSIGDSLAYSVPRLSLETSVKDLFSDRLMRHSAGQKCAIIADARFNLADRNIFGSLILVLEVGSMESIVRVLLSQTA